MSVVTDVVILASIGADETGAIERANQWLEEEQGTKRELTLLNDHREAYGGNKAFQACIWSGAYNYLQIPEFIAMLRSLDWGECVVDAAFQDEEDTGFNFVPIAGEGYREIYRPENYALADGPSRTTSYTVDDGYACHPLGNDLATAVKLRNNRFPGRKIRKTVVTVDTVEVDA